MIKLIIGILLLVATAQMDRRDSTSATLSTQIDSCKADLEKIRAQITIKDGEIEWHEKTSGLDTILPKYPGHKIAPRIWEENEVAFDKLNDLIGERNDLVKKEKVAVGECNGKIY